MACNPASGRVMQKAGMKFEGTLADEVFKDGQFHSLHVYGIINSERGGNVKFR
jgi:RimJ/RimL family protein N-acetyltransferase